MLILGNVILYAVLEDFPRYCIRKKCAGLEVTCPSTYT